MTNQRDILNDILSIDPDSDFLKYIIKRLPSDNYRGWHISQQNRIDLEVVEHILDSIYEVADVNFFVIPPGDYKDYKSGKNILTSDFDQFQEIRRRINSRIGKGTFDSVRKNFFTDLVRMDFFERKDRKRYGRITTKGNNLIKSKHITEKYTIFTHGVDKLWGNKISELAETISLSDYRGDFISIYEFMFILSDLESVDKISLIDSYRHLKKHQQQKVIQLIKEYADPRKFEGKTAKRDFGNWKNQTQQMMGIMKATVYFEVLPNRGFKLNRGRSGIFPDIQKRSPVPKKEYFTYHKTEKNVTFELHHVVPVRFAKNKEEMKLIDDYRNLIYISRSKHKEISKKKEEHVVLGLNPEEAIFSSFDKESVVKAENAESAIYTKDERKIENILMYNSKLLASIFEFQKSN